MKSYSKLQKRKGLNTYCKTPYCRKSTLMKMSEYCSKKCYAKHYKTIRVHNNQWRRFMLNTNNAKKVNIIAQYFLEEFVNEIND